LQELRQLGPDECRVAERIRLLMRSYDMDGIQRLLSQVARSPAVEGHSNAATPDTAASSPKLLSSSPTTAASAITAAGI